MLYYPNMLDIVVHLPSSEQHIPLVLFYICFTKVIVINIVQWCGLCGCWCIFRGGWWAGLSQKVQDHFSSQSVPGLESRDSGIKMDA